MSMSGRKTDGSWGLLRGESGGVFSGIDAELERVCALIRRSVEDTNAQIAEVLAGMDFCGGKLLRPGLVLLSGGATGGILDGHIAAGAMVELLHSASLLHDDVIDDAEMRRGRKTVNSQWNNTQAVLLGDYVLGVCFGLNREVNNEAVSTLFCETARSVCRGEMVQNLKRGDKLSEQEYFGIIEEKTARFFASCCEAGALLNGREESVCGALAGYGLHLGLAFQIMDDVLDIEGTGGGSAKTGGRDAAQRKMTLPVIHAMTRHDSAVSVQECLDTGDRFELFAVLRESGSLDYAREKAGHFCDKALSCLSDIAGGSYEDSLAELCGAVLRD